MELHQPHLAGVGEEAGQVLCDECFARAGRPAQDHQLASPQQPQQTGEPCPVDEEVIGQLLSHLREALLA